MKKVTTNMTFSQVLFILFILILASLMFFYLGAKFGSDVLTLADPEQSSVSEPFLPDAKLAEEIQTLLAARDQRLLFHDVVQGKKSMNEIRPQADKTTVTHKPITVVKSEAELKAEQAKLLRAETAKQSEKTSSPATTVTDNKEDQELAAATETQSVKPVADVAKTAKADAKIEQPKTVIAPRPSDDMAKKVIPPTHLTATLPSKLEPEEPKSLKTDLASISSPTHVASEQSGDDVLKTALQDTPAVDGAKVYRLQIGSYAQKNRALQAQSEWQARGYSVNLVETTIPGKGQWYRLQLGRYTSLPEVQSAQRQIMQQFQQTAMILTAGGR